MSYLINHYLLIVLFLTGLLAGTVDAIAGGGGLISLPVLLGIGVPPHIALGTSKFQGAFGTAIATYRYYRQGWLNRQGLIQGLFFSFSGAIFGATISQVLSSELLMKIIPILLLLVLIYSIFSPKLGNRNEEPKMKETGFYFIFGTLLGFYDGFFGPGAGSFWVICLIFFLGYNLLRATAYTKVFNLNTNIAGILCFIMGNNINYSFALCMGIGQIMGGWIGAHLAIKKGAKLIRRIFILVVFSTILSLVYKNYVYMKNDFMQPNMVLYAAIVAMGAFVIACMWFLIKRRRA